MIANLGLQIGLYLIALVAIVKPLGSWMSRVFQGHPTGLDRVLKPIECGLYRLAGVHPDDEMTWKTYCTSLLLLNGLGIVVVYLLLRWQPALPLNPQGFGASSPDLAFNTAVSFTSNTNWQSYGGETTLSYLSQMLALTVQNFLSAATGIAVLLALTRGFIGRSTQSVGNFWVDVTRSTLFVLLPLSSVLAVLLVSQGVLQNFSPYQSVTLLQPTTYDETVSHPDGSTSVSQVPVTTQQLPMGPVASQVAIKQLCTNGGGFFNVNSAHPFENPTPLSNFLQMLAILAIPAALCWTFGDMVGDRRQGWALLAAMFVIFVPLVALVVFAEQAGVPAYDHLGVNQAASDLQSGGNLEGKETRFGIVNSALWAAATTAASNGSVNAMHDSLTPLGGLVPMWLIQLGEVIFGGIGSGLYGMLMFAIVAVFVAGLMVGRTPEYLGKKIEAFEMKMAAAVILIPPVVVLIGTAIAIAGPGLDYMPADVSSEVLPESTTSNTPLAPLERGESALDSTAPTTHLKSNLNNPGAHGYSEVLYAFSSAGNNNGSAFAGLTANEPFYNWALGLAMLIARYGLIVPVLAIAGSLASKKLTPPGAGTLPTHGTLFVVLLVGPVLLVGALTFVPSLALGPIIEHLQMMQ